MRAQCTTPKVNANLIVRYCGGVYVCGFNVVKPGVEGKPNARLLLRTITTAHQQSAHN